MDVCQHFSGLYFHVWVEALRGVDLLARYSGPHWEILDTNFQIFTAMKI
jgi:hypothetical protein